MPRPESSSCFSGFETRSGIAKPARRDRPQQLACDRCRGQKLRCIRTSNPDAPCERCQKAGATCIIDSSVRMGRPRRIDKEQRESTSISHIPRQSTGSPTRPTTSSHTASGGFTPQGDTWSGHDLDETVDPTLRGVTVQYLESFDFGLLGDATLGDSSLDISPEHYLDSTLDLSLDHPIPALTEDEDAAINDTTRANGHNYFPPMHQETMQELSDLNMQLYRQLSVVGPMANTYTSIDPGLGSATAVTPPDGNHTLSDTVVFMMHGLQTYHRLLIEILGSTGLTHSAVDDLQDNTKSSTVASSLLSPAEGIDSKNPKGGMYMSRSASQPPRRKRIRLGGSGTDLAVLHDSANPRRSALLDMPASLLLLSCHTNLVYLCRDVFAAIRAALLATPRQITLFTFSFLHIDEVSIPQDPDLQIIVLTQAVVRLTDRIGRLLGFSNDYEAHSNAIPPQLLEIVLRGEANSGGQADRVGMEALRREIRGLHELVYKPV